MCCTPSEICGSGGTCCAPQHPSVQCGAVSDGCGNTYDGGSCAPGDLCQGNTCCHPLGCVDQGAECGSVSDNCGGTVTCATCPGNEVCVGHQCCTPATCAVGSCGTISDGCGSTVNCGNCGAGFTCLSGSNTCCQQAQCTDQTCNQTISDGCGGTLHCPACHE